MSDEQLASQDGRTAVNTEMQIVAGNDDVLAAYQHSPIGKLLKAHNLGAKFEQQSAAELLILTCMDHRIALNIPNCFAYVLRVAGANAEPVAFNVSFAVAVAKIKSIAVIGHSDCAMQRLDEGQDTFVDGLREQFKWNDDQCASHYEQGKRQFAIDDAADATLQQVKKLRSQYPGVEVAPLYYRVEDHKLYQLIEA